MANWIRAAAVAALIAASASPAAAQDGPDSPAEAGQGLVRILARNGMPGATFSAAERGAEGAVVIRGVRARSASGPTLSADAVTLSGFEEMPDRMGFSSVGFRGLKLGIAGYEVAIDDAEVADLKLFTVTDIPTPKPGVNRTRVDVEGLVRGVTAASVTVRGASVSNAEGAAGRVDELSVSFDGWSGKNPFPTAVSAQATGALAARSLNWLGDPLGVTLVTGQEAKVASTLSAKIDRSFGILTLKGAVNTDAVGSWSTQATLTGIRGKAQTDLGDALWRAEGAPSLTAAVGAANVSKAWVSADGMEWLAPVLKATDEASGKPDGQLRDETVSALRSVLQRAGATDARAARAGEALDAFLKAPKGIAATVEPARGAPLSSVLSGSVDPEALRLEVGAR